MLDRAADVLAAPLAAAKTAAGVKAAGAALLELHTDADALLCASGAFLLARVLDQAAALGRAAGPEQDADFYDRMARAQVTTWLPACQSPGEFAGGVCSIHHENKNPPLQDYANKVWGGLTANHYGGRVDCYTQQACAPPRSFRRQARLITLDVFRASRRRPTSARGAS